MTKNILLLTLTISNTIILLCFQNGHCDGTLQCTSPIVCCIIGGSISIISPLSWGRDPYLCVRWCSPVPPVFHTCTKHPWTMHRKTCMTNYTKIPVIQTQKRPWKDNYLHIGCLNSHFLINKKQTIPIATSKTVRKWIWPSSLFSVWLVWYSESRY